MSTRGAFPTWSAITDLAGACEGQTLTVAATHRRRAVARQQLRRTWLGLGKEGTVDGANAWAVAVATNTLLADLAHAVTAACIPTASKGGTSERYAAQTATAQERGQPLTASDTTSHTWQSGNDGRLRDGDSGALQCKRQPRCEFYDDALVAHQR